MFRSIFSEETPVVYDWQKFSIPNNTGDQQFYDPYIWIPVNQLDWVKINPMWEICTKTKTVGRETLKSIKDEITEARRKNQQIIFLFSCYDAVKNSGLSTTKNLSILQEEARKLYNILPGSWKKYSYEQKADSIRKFQLLKSEPTLNTKQWSLQQWPHNLIRYCKINEIKLIYVQADHTYCKFPSVFAEAMADTLYTHYRSLDYYNHCFKGKNNTLYCLGDVGVAKEIANFLEMQYPGISILDNSATFKKYPTLNPDINWVIMSDSYLNDVFSRITSGKLCCSPFSYFNYPWDIISRRSEEPIVPITVTVNGKKLTGTYVSDIFPSKDFVYSLISTKTFEDYDLSHPISFSCLHLPLSYLAPDNSFFKYNIQMYYTKRIVSNSISYDGTYTCPVVAVDGEIIPDDLKDRIIFQSLAHEYNFGNL